MEVFGNVLIKTDLHRGGKNTQTHEPVTPTNRTSHEVEQCVLAWRKQLKAQSPLGEHGCDAIRREMQQRECPLLPSRATINCILKRHGTLEGRR